MAKIVNPKLIVLANAAEKRVYIQLRGDDGAEFHTEYSSSPLHMLDIGDQLTKAAFSLMSLEEIQAYMKKKYPL